MLFRLNIDHDGVYWGATEINADDYKDGDVTLDHAPDNPPGRYKWNGVLGQMEALPASQIKSGDDGVDYERALYELTKTLHQENSSQVSAITIRWCKQYEQTIDGAIGTPLRYFRDWAQK